MRYVSEQFKAIQDEILRPPMQIYFEVDTNIEHIIGVGGYDEDDRVMAFDYTVAPVMKNISATNGYYYAVLGDNSPVDDPNRICAPDNSLGTLSEPTHTVPCGVTPITVKNTEALIGSDEQFYYNFAGFLGLITLCFKGHIPDEIRIEKYDFENEVWLPETIIYNPDLNEEVSYTPADPSEAGNFRRFWVKNADRSGRFQLNWVMRNDTTVPSYDHPGHLPVVFENSLVSSVSIDLETDLTSQSLPSYEMTVECLDVDEEYTPDTEYWKYQFRENRPCYLKAGYDINGITEYVPLMYGKLTQAPTYGEGKLTFRIAVDWKFEWDVEFGSKPNDALTTGDIVDSVLFSDILNQLFNSYDVFHGDDDIYGSECNYYGIISGDEARQLVANALGCYITAGSAAIDLHNAVDIQSKVPIDYLTRYEQVQATLESQPKVGKIVITRNENLLSADYVDITAPASVSVEADDYVDIIYNLPFYAFGKFTVTNYNKSVSSANVFVASIHNDGVNEDGTYKVTVTFSSDRTTNIRPAIRFFGVTNNKYEETDTSDNVEGEVYKNDNDLITNGYTAGKARQVAHLMNDSSNKYEVDMIQDFRYEIGDVIKLETKANTFEPCVITGLKYSLPGSNGHATLRKIFSYSASQYFLENAEGMTITIDDTVFRQTVKITILEVEGDYCAVGVYNDELYNALDFLMLNVKRYTVQYDNDEPTERSYSWGLIDNAGKMWKFSAKGAFKHSDYVTDIPAIMVLPDIITDPGGNLEHEKLMSVTMIKALYEEQGLVAPIDYECKMVYDPE